MPIVSLIANPAAPDIDGAIVARVQRVAGGESEVRWLGDGEAVEFAVPTIGETPARDLEAAIRETLHGLPIDVAIVPEHDRRKRLLVADMDSTIIGQECIDELAAHVGLRDQVAAITESAMIGELGFEEALRERLALLRGLDVAVIQEILAQRIRITPGAIALVRTMKANGARTALVSGGFTHFTSRIAADVGFDHHNANRLQVENGEIKGVVEPILGQEAKRDALEALAAAEDLPMSATLAVGDGANDLAMVTAAGLGVAFHAKPALRKVADARIDHGDLTALLFLQGYRKSEFVE